MIHLQYKTVAAFADGVVDLSSIIDELLGSDVDNSLYDDLIALSNRLHDCEIKVRRQYALNSLYEYHKRK